MRILGLDPGSRKTGWAIVGGSPGRPILGPSGVISLPTRAPFAERMARLHEACSTLMDEHRPDQAAVEAPFHGISARSALQLAHARGVILAAVAARGIEVAEYSPATIKRQIAGNGRADKQQVAFVVERLVGRKLPSTSSDLSDAIAVGLCHLTHAVFESTVGRRALRAARETTR